ncbi:actin interacting protein 3-domain-containing protein [Halteromyces radiatus]|uniref:actin interacting protein 3-domain-containing protein n=1 Tax=Halteromyces radiatus TaxID=101107 RepID=UPI00221F2E79|nr:actin interacting protein 3-domain-containing protein [Halteromyces radiatus]KAI8097338.1 actin interacting protein 3-domain-containing protein [Halteromyces radiatus]
MDYGSRENVTGYSPIPARRSDIQRTGSYRSMSGEIEQVVTHLLRTTKSLLEALNLWSQLRMSSADISELHHTLEAQFYRVSQSFEEAHVKTSDLAWIPHKLRQSVEECMNQEPSTMALDQYLPRIRDVIVHLLHGLKGKQQQLREMDAQMSQMPSSPPPQQQHSGVPLSARDSYRSQESWHRNSDNYVRGSTNLSHSESTGSNKSDRLTHSNYDPYTGGMPQPTLSSDARKFYNQSSRPSSPQQKAYRKLSHTSSSPSSTTPIQQPIPSRSASRTLPTSTPPPPPPPPPVVPTGPSRHLQPINNNSFDENDPNTASALAALKRQENLARRSSVRRASMYRGNTSADYASKRFLSDAPPLPSLPTTSSTLPLNRVDEDKATGNDFIQPIAPSLGHQSTGNDNMIRGSTDNDTNKTVSNVDDTTTQPSALTLYLQMGKQTKKVSYSGEVTLPALSMLFIERFGYNAGQQDFPSIYICDPTFPTVSYELQDLTEVRDKSILSLTPQDANDEKSVDVNSLIKEWNETRRVMMEQMERLEQKLTEQQAPDTEALVQEIVRQTLATASSSSISATEHAEVTSKDDPPTEDVHNNDITNENTTVITKDDNNNISTVTAGSNDDIPSTKIQQEQRDEIEKLQRQVMVLRQAQTELQDERNKLVQDLQDKDQQLKDLTIGDKEKEALKEARKMAKATPSEARQYIEQGKEELLTSSDKITMRLEDLQDAIDHLKLDVTQRKCRPSEVQMTHCREERKALADDIEEFGTYIGKVKPIWKKTWEQELQTIVKEQQTLKEQEGLLMDMNDDLEALQEVFENLEKIYAFQEKSRHNAPSSIREFRVAPPEDGFEGMTSVLKQVATIDVDHDRRLKALEMADRMRQRELANRIDDFEKELTSFVDHKKLKKTGGAMEIDRLRQQKDKDMIQRLYMEKQQQQQQQQQEVVEEGNENQDDGKQEKNQADPISNEEETEDKINEDNQAD